MKATISDIMIIITITWFTFSIAGAEELTVTAQKLKRPEVRIVSPHQGEKVRGKLTIEAIASHTEAIEFMDFYFQEPGAKDRYSWQDYCPPYFWGGARQMLDTTLFNDGPASVAVFFKYKNGSWDKTERRVHFYIENGKPNIKIVSPLDQTEISNPGKIPILIKTSDPIGINMKAGISAVHIYVDGELTQTFTKEPFKTSLSTCLISPGRHSIRAVAQDSEGLTNADNIMFHIKQSAGSLPLKLSP